ncbi:hypothetical protein Tco_0676490 [Tanacetum coccineum]
MGSVPDRVEFHVSINSILKSRDGIFNKNRFYLVPKPSIRIPNGTEDIGGSVVPEEVTKELYLIEGARDEDVAFIERVTINDEMDSSWDIQHLGVADMPSGMAGTFRALDKSQGLRLLGYLCLRKFDETSKGVIICLYIDDMLIFGTYQVQVDLTKEFLSSRFAIKDMGEADVILDIRIKMKVMG